MRRCRLVLVVVVVVIAVVFGIGCHGPPDTSSGVTVEFRIRAQPVRIGPIVISLTLTDANNHPVTGAQIQVEADMSHAGMSPVFAPASEVQPGRYESIFPSGWLETGSS